MGVRPGYKQTEVGVIPEDWEVAPIAELVIVGPKNGYSGRSGKEARGTPTLSLGATTLGSMVLNEETVKRLDETIPTNSDLYLKPGDVLVQRSNTIDLVGTTAIFDGFAGVYVYPDLMMRMRFRDDATSHWFWRYANSANGRRFFVSVAAGSSGSMPKISGEKLRKMQLPLPPLPEQRAIAEALSDVDRLLAALDRLIAKKRDLKQAAMQQLLTGQTRLPGFHGEWKVEILSTICSMKSGEGITSASIDQFSKFPCYGGNGIRGYAARFTHDGRYALVGRQGALCGNVYGVEGKFFASEHAIVVTGFEETDIRWLTSVLTRMNLNQFSESSAQPGLSVSKILNLELTVPPTKTEQTAIAEVLSDMDAELAALERRRDKTSLLKQAMMQELLTGRIRLL